LSGKPTRFILDICAADAVAVVDAIVAMPGVQLPSSGPEWPKLRQLCLERQLTGNDLPDAWLAAAVEHHAEHLVPSSEVRHRSPKRNTPMNTRSLIAVMLATLAGSSAAHAQDAVASCRQFCDGDARTCRAEARRQARAEENAESGSDRRQEDAIGGSARRAASNEGVRSRLDERLGHCDQARRSCQRQCMPAPAEPASGARSPEPGRL